MRRCVGWRGGGEGEGKEGEERGKEENIRKGGNGWYEGRKKEKREREEKMGSRVIVEGKEEKGEEGGES